MAFEVVRVDRGRLPLLDDVAPEVFDRPVVPGRAGELAAAVDELLVLATVDGTVVAQCTAQVQHRAFDDPELYVSDLATSPSYRRRGIARALVAEVFTWGRERGCSTAWLAVEPDDQDALAFYAALGSTPEAATIMSFDLCLDLDLYLDLDPGPGPAPRLVVAHTSELGKHLLDRVHRLLAVVFDDLESSDWEHALGGVHALVVDGDRVLAHAAVVQRRMVVEGVVLRCGYVEGVAVHPDGRGQGHGATVMAAVERVITSAYDLGALGATDEAADFYEHRGWGRWPGTTAALTPDGVRATPEEDGAIFVWPAERAGVGVIIADWRDGDVW